MFENVIYKLYTSHIENFIDSLHLIWSTTQLILGVHLRIVTTSKSSD
jgi:hypothetical protein